MRRRRAMSGVEGGGLLLEEGGRVDDGRCPAWREVGSSLRKWDASTTSDVRRGGRWAPPGGMGTRRRRAMPRLEGGGLLLEEGGRVDDGRCPARREVGSSWRKEDASTTSDAPPGGRWAPLEGRGTRRRRARPRVEGGGLLLEEGRRVDDARGPAWREVGSSWRKEDASTTSDVRRGGRWAPPGGRRTRRRRARPVVEGGGSSWGEGGRVDDERCPAWREGGPPGGRGRVDDERRRRGGRGGSSWRKGDASTTSDASHGGRGRGVEEGERVDATERFHVWCLRPEGAPSSLVGPLAARCLTTAPPGT